MARLGGEHGLEERRVGGGEVDHLLALGVLAQRGDDQVGLLGLQVGDAVGAGHRHQLDLHAQLGGDVVGHVDVQALRLEVGADEAVGRKVGRDGDGDELLGPEVVDTGEYADAVRERERLYLDAGIHSVPAVIINDRHLIAGGQPPEVFEQALRQIAAES
jgi:hypothetical protein